MVVVASPPRRETRSSDREPPLVADPPEWVTPNEAAYLAGVDLSRIRSWIGAGLVESSPVLRDRRDAGMRLIRARDLAWALEREDDQAHAEEPSVPTAAAKARRWPRLRGYVQAGLGVVLLLVWLNAIRPSVVAEPGSGGDARSAIPPVPADDTLAPPSAPGLTSSTIVVNWVGFVRDGDLFDVAAEVANPDPHRWLPTAGAAFVFLDASGAVLSTTSVPMSIGPGGERTVMANGVDLGGVSPDEVASVELVPTLQPLLPKAQYEPPHIRLSHVRLERTRHNVSATGLIVDGGPERHALTITCALRAASGELAQVASIEEAKIPADRTIPFEVPFRHAEARHDSVTCSILP